MSDKIQEQISALLDNELSTREAADILDRLREQDDLQTQWDRFHLIGDVMRGEATQINASETVARVRRSLESEPAMIAAPRIKSMLLQGPLWVRSLAGAGLAASVAALAVITAPHFLDSNPGDAMQIAATENAVTSPYSEQRGTRWKNLKQPEVESKLNGYLVEHGEYASPGGISGVVPYATFVGYDAAKKP
jgi:sigma-E factor negative regulatory protein RseA